MKNFGPEKKGITIKSLIIFVVMFVLPILLLSFSASASAEELKSTELMNFNSTSDSGSVTGSARRKMILFDFKDDLECPVFSNSPYTEALDSIEKMQSQINKVFPPCDQKDKTQELTQATQKFRDKIAQSQKLQKTGFTTQFNSVVKEALMSANQLQNLLGDAIKAPVSVCAQSNQKERKNIIFQINDTFQSLSPVILDLVSQNPALSVSFAPYMKILVGAEGISKNISMIETLVKESEMFDMSISENRKNTIKNVCQFMKFYRRLKYLRHSRFEDVQKLTAEYDQKIRKMQNKVDSILSVNLRLNQNGQGPRPMAAMAPTPQGPFKTMSADLSMQSSTDPKYDAFIQLTDESKGAAASRNLIKSTMQFVDDMKTQLGTPEISQCQNIMKEINRKEHKTNMNALLLLGSYYNEFQAERFATSAEAYLENIKQLNLKNRADLKDCVVLGIDWLTSYLQAFEQTDALTKKFEDELIALNGAEYFKNHRQLNKTKREIQNKKSELAKIQTMIDVASFESSEVEKNARGLYRFFLNGPKWDEISSESTAKKMTIWAVNKGPVYSLLKNTESNFLDAVDQIRGALSKIQAYEKQWALKLYGGRIPSDTKKFLEWKNYEEQLITKLPHVTPENFPQGSARHQIVCNNAALALDYYIQAATHLNSSENLCLMIKPAIIESEVSPALRAYCEVTPGHALFNSQKDRLSDIDQMMAKMVGGTASIKSVIDHLLEKLQNLKCE